MFHFTRTSAILMTHPFFESREERIRYITQLMFDRRWPKWPHTAAFRRELAAAWGCAEATIRDYAAVASRDLRPDADERDAMREQFAKRMLRLGRKAERSINSVTNQPDIASAIKATTEAARLLGLDPEKRVNVSGGIALESIDELKKRLNGEVGE